ncbi:hypothetical protein F3Y22_tig00110226pilonHSYRG00060 [Hibiscus syriacus]|uniref:Uncharacterized protein n=1 Tax=Hibiscus syriacus TaxID=106335 RepID=A0A6A3B7H4_HIBSY|nr:hypothetical protein F3Y22_tig00110226pilonHSYRG00060 [Hibiscus syriacus]
MSRLAVLFTVTFLSLTVTHARLIGPEQTVIPEDTVTGLPGSDHIDLPGEKTEPDSDLDTVPLTMTSFRPINGHFPMHPLVPFRHKHDYHSHKRFRPSNPRFQRTRYISYGNDMVLSDERIGFVADQLRGFGPQIQARRDRFSNNGVDLKEHVDFRNPHHHNHEHEH